MTDGKEKSSRQEKLMPAKEVTVKSLFYGEHKRAARGDKTPVGLNDAFAKHNAKTAMAKRVHDLLKHCGKHFKEVMLSRMRKAALDDGMVLLTTLKGMDAAAGE